MTDPEGPYAAPRPAEPPSSAGDPRQRLARWASALALVFPIVDAKTLVDGVLRGQDPLEVGTAAVCLAASLVTAVGLFRLGRGLRSPLGPSEAASSLGPTSLLLSRSLALGGVFALVAFALRAAA